MKNNTVNIPNFLNENFQFSHFKVLNIDRLYVGLKDSNIGNIKYVNIKKTPHYYFVCEYLGTQNKHKENKLIIMTISDQPHLTQGLNQNLQN